MEDKKFKVIIVEDVKLELKGTEEIFRHEIPNAEVSRATVDCTRAKGDTGFEKSNVPKV